MDQLATVDWIIVVIIGVSTLLSLLRGFVREALSLASWGVAFFVAVAFHDQLMEALTGLVDKPYIRDIAAYVILFGGALIAGSIATHLIAALVQKTGLSSTDRLLGMIFGAARGAVVVTALVILLPKLLEGVERDLWWQQSLFIPQFQMMQDWSEQTFRDLVQMVSEFVSRHRG